MFRTTSGTRRVMLLLCVLLLSLVFVLPKQSRSLLQGIGQPLAQLLSLPMTALAALDRGVQEAWYGYLALHQVSEENRRLQRELQALRGRNNELRELGVAGQRLAAVLGLKERLKAKTLAAQVIGWDATNWYRAIVLDKGSRDGVKVEMGVMAPDGAVGRVVKVMPFTAMVLLITDPNNAVTGLIQRTRDEGIVEGTPEGRARMKYIPLLATLQSGDVIVTSGLTGGFPRGVPLGTITRIDKAEGELFQSAEIVPEVDLHKLEEVLVITDPLPVGDGLEPPAARPGPVSSEGRP
ncbi:MAG: rod shape-determining protein MreC [Nitrospira sp.]|nr:rod shape-determining protein MreC [Nitrospira sp.]